jgi:hypothetical protein
MTSKAERMRPNFGRETSDMNADGTHEGRSLTAPCLWRVSLLPF